MWTFLEQVGIITDAEDRLEEEELRRNVLTQYIHHGTRAKVENMGERRITKHENGYVPSCSSVFTVRRRDVKCLAIKRASERRMARRREKRTEGVKR